MTKTINVDEATWQAIDIAARLTSMTHGQIVERLVSQSRLSAPAAAETNDGACKVFADYEGHRTSGVFDRLTKRIDITDGALAGTSYKSPSSAARAVVSHYKPEVSPHRNGWSFWQVDDGSGRFLQRIRHD